MANGVDWYFMRDRKDEVWEAKGHMNGERVVVVLESRAANSRYGECTVHRVLHITGPRAARVLEWTEQGSSWDVTPGMVRLA